MDNIETYRSESPSMLERNTMLWGVFLVGLVMGFVGVYLVVAQPMFAQMDRMQRQVVSVQSDLELLVGVRDQAWDTNNLLSGLTAQQKQIAEARATVKEVRLLRQDLQTESATLAASFNALNELAKLKTAIIDQKDATGMATRAIEEIAGLNNRLIREHGTTPRGEATLADLQQVKLGLEELIRLKSQILEQGTDVSDAQVKAGELLALKDVIVAQGTDTVSAQKSAGELIDLKDRVVKESDNVEAALVRAGQLMELQQNIVGQKTDMDAAFANLDSLVQIKARLADQTQEVADALQNLEIIADFQGEFNEQVRTLHKMRQTLLEIVMLESTISRVSRIIEPLAQIGNVRRLSDVELRDAARVILDKRSATRLSEKIDTETHPESKSDRVPEPQPLSADESK